MLSGDRDDSDLEHNIGRLCQYLSGSEDGDDEDNRQEIESVVINGSIIQRPAGLFLLNSRHSAQKRSIESGTSSSLVSDENFNCEPMPTHQQQADTNFAQVIPMQRLVPRGKVWFRILTPEGPRANGGRGSGPKTEVDRG